MTDDIRGINGKAERLNLDNVPQSKEASLAQWLMFLPGAHPLWQHYLLAVCHLRETPGVMPATKHYPEAEYEILVLALDPQGKPNSTDRETWHPLSPANYVQQFDGLTDEQAVRLADLVVRGFVEGPLLVEPQGVYGAREQFSHFFATARRQVLK